MKKLTFLIPTSLIGLALVSSAVGQRQQTNNTKSVRIDKKLPTVFLALERIDPETKTVYGRRSERRVWFRLRNNSIWLIRIEASGGNKVFVNNTLEDASLYYDTLDVKGNINAHHPCHVCSINGLASGKSVLFSVPYDEVAEANSLRIEFRYQWEDMVDVAPAFEPTHYVCFYSRDLEGTK